METFLAIQLIALGILGLADAALTYRILESGRELNPVVRGLITLGTKIAAFFSKTPEKLGRAIALYGKIPVLVVLGYIGRDLVWILVLAYALAVAWNFKQWYNSRN